MLHMYNLSFNNVTYTLYLPLQVDTSRILVFIMKAFEFLYETSVLRHVINKFEKGNITYQSRIEQGNYLW